MTFPVEVLGGKCIPELMLRLGCGFRMGSSAEIASQFGAEKRDALSDWPGGIARLSRESALCFQMNTLRAERDDSPRKHSSMLKYPEDRRSYAGLLLYMKHSMRRLTR